MKVKTAKNLLAIILSALLIIAMQLIQSGSVIESFKFWICFIIIVATLIYIIYVVCGMVKNLNKASKEIDLLNKQIEELQPKEEQITENAE
jgi:cell shape-determining protein MreC